MKVSNAKGTQDFLPGAALRRRFVIDRLARAFERYGFEPLETPAFENIETLTGKYGEEGEKLVFKILKRGEGGKAGDADLALRYDLTVPLARVVAMYPELPRPFKRYQIAPVWRAEKPQRGRYREFVQCDIDVAGSSSPVVEIELLGVACGVYEQLGFHDHVVDLNHRQILTGLMLAAGVETQDVTSYLITLDKLDKVGRDGVLDELQKKGAGDAQLSALRDLLTWVEAIYRGELSRTQILDSLRARLEGQPAALDGVDNLSVILKGLDNAGIPPERVRLNPALARGLGYYTGAIFEVVLSDFGSSVGGGGRYDNLVGMFSGRPVPCSGISFGLDRILLLMNERKLFPESISCTQVLVPLYDASLQDESLKLAHELRSAGLNVDLFPDAVRLGTQLQYGTARGIPVAAIVGPDELKEGMVTVRNLVTRSQSKVPRETLVDHLLAGLTQL